MLNYYLSLEIDILRVELEVYELQSLFLNNSSN